MILDESKFPKTWEELKSMSEFIKSTDIENARYPDDQLFYTNYINLVSKDIRHQILFNTYSGKDKIILKNPFPYSNLIKNIPFVNHYCLWNCHGQLSGLEIKNEIETKFPRLDYFWFENEEFIKSIPEIWHCHIFVKEK